MSDNTHKLMNEIQRRAELRLASQLAIALAADSRALTFSGLCLTAASLLVGLATIESEPAMYGAAVFLYAGAALAAYTARPVNWGAPGQPGSDFDDDVKDNVSFQDVQKELVKHLDEQIRINDFVLSENARYFRAGAMLALSSPVFGMLVHYLCPYLDSL